MYEEGLVCGFWGLILPGFAGLHNNNVLDVMFQMCKDQGVCSGSCEFIYCAQQQAVLAKFKHKCAAELSVECSGILC